MTKRFRHPWTQEEDASLMRDYRDDMKHRELVVKYGVSVAGRITKLRNDGHDLPRRLLRGEFTAEPPLALRYTYSKERDRQPEMKTACRKCGSLFKTTLHKTRHTKRDCSVSFGIKMASESADGWWTEDGYLAPEETVETDELIESLKRTITAEDIVKAFEERIKGIDEIFAEKDRQIEALNEKLILIYREHQSEIDRVKAQREQIEARSEGLIDRLFNR